MGRLLPLCFVLMSVTTHAAHFPVTVAYGTAAACAAFAEGGVEAVEAGQDVSAMLVTPTDVAAPGLRCPADNAEVDGKRVTAICTLAEGQPFKLAATIEEDAAGATVKYSSATAIIILNRCN